MVPQAIWPLATRLVNKSRISASIRKHLQSDEDEQFKSPAGPSPTLQWRDYVALTIAALESTFLPILLIMLAVIALTMVIIHFWMA
jgi:hypothetical protein